MTTLQELKDNEYNQDKLSELLEEYLMPGKSFEIEKKDHEFLKRLIVRWQYSEQFEGKTLGLLENEGFKQLRHDISISILENQSEHEFLNNPFELKSQEDPQSFNTLAYVDTEDMLSFIFRHSMDEISSINQKNKLKEKNPKNEKIADIVDSDIKYHKNNLTQLVQLISKCQATDVAYFLISKLKEFNEPGHLLQQQVVNEMLKHFVDKTEASQLVSILAAEPDLISLSNESHASATVNTLKKHFAGDNYKRALSYFKLSPASSLDDLKKVRASMLKAHHSDKSGKSEGEHEVSKINDQYNLLLPAFKLRSILEQKLDKNVFLLSLPTSPSLPVDDALYHSRDWDSIYKSANTWDIFESDEESDDYSSGPQT